MKRLGVIALMAWVAIEVHELAHLLAYTIAGYRRRAILRTSLVYALTLAIGILAIVLDDLLGARAS